MKLRRPPRELTDEELAEAVAEAKRREEERSADAAERTAAAILDDLRQEQQRIAALPVEPVRVACVGYASEYVGWVTREPTGDLKITDVAGGQPRGHVVVLEVPEGTWHKHWQAATSRHAAEGEEAEDGQ